MANLGAFRGKALAQSERTAFRGPFLAYSPKSVGPVRLNNSCCGRCQPGRQRRTAWRARTGSRCMPGWVWPLASARSGNACAATRAAHPWPRSAWPRPPSGLVRCALKNPYRDGTAHIARCQRELVAGQRIHFEQSDYVSCSRPGHPQYCVCVRRYHFD